MRILNIAVETVAARLLGVVAIAAAAAPACAGDITYSVNQSIGSGSVVGQIVTDGKTGVLSTGDIVSWNFNLSAPGATYALTSVGHQSDFGVVGSDLTATTQGLYFNFSGTDGGHVGIQQANQINTGLHYICYNTNWFGCSAGASVVPGANTDSSAQYDTTWIGIRILGTSGPSLSAAELYRSIELLAASRMAQMLVNQLQSQTLVGLNEQVSCGNCAGAGTSFGSFNLSAHGRYAFSPEWTVLGGVDLGQYAQKGARVNFDAGFASAIQYDPIGMGRSRPYAEAGVAVSYQTISYRRSYVQSDGVSQGDGSTQGYQVSAFVEAGWVDRLTPRDEAAVYGRYSRLWQIVNGYAEAAGSANPFNATVPTSTDVLDVAGLNAQYTHLFGRRIEANLNGGVEWAFGAHSGLRATMADAQVTASQPGFVYYQAGGRLGVRLARRLTVDLFVNGVMAPAAIGSSVHGGFGFRWTF